MSARRPDDTTVAADAARWLARRDRGPALSPAETREFEAWLHADPRHRTEFELLAGHWALLDGLGEFRPVTAGRPVADLPLRPRRARFRPLARRLAPLAAAAAVALAAGLLWQHHTLRAPHATFARTAVGAQETLALPDGSTVVLNTDSAVRVELTAAERRIELVRGEAFFTVAPDKARPFVVSAGAVRVRALGTAFNVRRDAADVEVLVTHGRVGVVAAAGAAPLLAPTAAEPAPTLTAGQRTVVRAAAPGAAIEALTPLDVSRRLAWQERRLEFGPTPLREIVAEFNRYSPRRLVIAEPALGDLSVGGSFRVGDEETLLRFLQASFPIEAERTDRETVLRSRR